MSRQHRDESWIFQQTYAAVRESPDPHRKDCWKQQDEPSNLSGTRFCRSVCRKFLSFSWWHTLCIHAHSVGHRVQAVMVGLVINEDNSTPTRTFQCARSFIGTLGKIQFHRVSSRSLSIGMSKSLKPQESSKFHSSLLTCTAMHWGTPSLTQQICPDMMVYHRPGRSPSQILLHGQREQSTSSALRCCREVMSEAAIAVWWPECLKSFRKPFYY